MNDNLDKENYRIANVLPFCICILYLKFIYRR